MKGISFGNYHSYDDFNLLLVSKEVGSPSVKSREIDIPGADGSLDLTDFFGEAKYENLTHKFQFAAIVPHNNFLSLYSNIKNKIHGKKLRIILDDDPAFYYVGRCFVSAFTNEKNIGTVAVECVCEPWKHKLNQTIVQKTISGSGTVTLSNSRKRAVPRITATASMTIRFGGSSWTINAGTTTIPDFELTEGSNTVTVTGTGTITFAYQEAGL